MTNKQAVRSRGVTLVEVIFSMGVVLIGLLGVMSILPLAGNRAKDAVGLSVASALADNVMEEMLAQRWLSNGRLAAYDDKGNLVPFDGSRPFCIDPAFVSIGGRQVAANPNPPNSYDTRFFPFYKENHDPTLDPSAPNSIALGVNPQRMLRVGIMQRPSSLGTPLIPLTRDQALRVADSPDDLLVERPKARTDNPFLLGVQATNAGLPYGGRFGSGDFSWIATVSPNSSPGYVTVSVAVIRNRQRGFAVPVTAALNPEQNATDERMATISFSSGFQGGAGGSIELNGAENTVSRLRVGDWLMLSRSGVNILVNRWFRVAAVEREVEKLNIPRNEIGHQSTNNSDRPIWRRRVYLDGPDFPFRNAINPSNQIQTTDTLAVLVDGVVSVTEHVVRLREM